MIFFFP